MAASDKTLDDLFVDMLKDVYSAEKQILAALGKMTKMPDSEKLALAFDTHRAETEGQIERLEQIFASIGKPPQGKTCAAMQGILQEANEMAEEFKAATLWMRASSLLRKRSNITRLLATARSKAGPW